MTQDQNDPVRGERRLLSRRSVLTTMGALPVITAATSVLGATEAAAATAAINPSAQRQTIRGFGGMAHAAWIGDLTAAQRETAFGTGEGRLGFSILRIPVGESQADFGRDLATAKRAAELGVTVFASPWNPPASMIETFNRNGQTNAKRLRYDQYAAYAQHLNSFSTYMRNNGVNLYAISVQNEPDYAHDWTWWTSTEMVKFLRENAGSINTRVIAPESFQYVKSVSDPILNDSTALANVDIIGAHLYGTSYSNFPYPLFKQKGAGKDLWMTEVYYPNSTDSADTWPQALDVGEHMHRAMVEAEFQAYVWWYIRRSYGPMREDGQLSKRGAIMAQFARFVRPGYVRIDATANPASNVYVSAYRSGDTVVIVAINKGTSAVSQQFTVANATSASVSSWVTDGSRNVAAQAATSMSNGSLTVTLPARSMTTFVTSLSGGSSPSPSPVLSPTPSPTPSPSASPSGGTGTGPRVAYTMSSWNSGFTASISITNTGTSTINGWTLNFTLPSGQSITSGWNATYSPSSGQVSAANVSYNGTIAPGATVDIGFQATHTGNTAEPTAFTLNGVPCTVV
ncbi:cellulose binding domain-containing protein [Microbispora bryophytorum]|uniref:Glucuronoxylanase xynC n=2 Tax=Microbispora bryophytorum TaxID=1460882 RepID=A0A8H9HBR1_9ACTN|nr:cellulose binding domain-containing protein [Microbispora bryophytorum]MBD3141501.1 cellulose binding domain-containing protein [Microbispora bryophytorum]TQR98420.1 cellulose-binding protein [Microbispora bryophytorum]GGO32474.1 glucuronoxylanase xynC [Microbispora bryophytorum]